MKASLNSAPGYGHTPRVRALACFLFSLIAFTSVVEAAHNHGGVTVGRPDAHQTFDQRRDADTTGGRLPDGDGCLICQLQTHLTGGLLYGPFHLLAPKQRRVCVSAETFSYLSVVCGTGLGRAPPLTSLY